MKIVDFIISKVVPHIDVDGDGKFTVDDLKAAAHKAEEELKAKQTNWFVGSLVALAAYGAGVVSCLVFFCRH